MTPEAVAKKAMDACLAKASETAQDDWRGESVGVG